MRILGQCFYFEGILFEGPHPAVLKDYLWHLAWGLLRLVLWPGIESQLPQCIPAHWAISLAPRSFFFFLSVCFIFWCLTPAGAWELLPPLCSGVALGSALGPPWCQGSDPRPGPHDARTLTRDLGPFCAKHALSLLNSLFHLFLF